MQRNNLSQWALLKLSLILATNLSNSSLLAKDVNWSEPFKVLKVRQEASSFWLQFPDGISLGATPHVTCKGTTDRRWLVIPSIVSPSDQFMASMILSSTNLNLSIRVKIKESICVLGNDWSTPISAVELSI